MRPATLVHHIAGVLAGLVLFLLPAAAGAATLDDVRERGFVICGATNALPGFAQQSANGLWSGFDVDFCRAVAAAVFGNPDQVEFRALNGTARFAHLQTGEIDLLSRNAPWTLARDTQYGANYVATYFYDGLAFLVPQALGAVSAYEFEDISVCVSGAADERSAVREFFFMNQVSYTEIVYEAREDLRVAYSVGRCDAVAAPASWLHGMRRQLADPATHRILPERLTKEPMGPVVRQGDDEWFDIVKWTVYAIIAAEELGVTSLNIEPMREARNGAIRRLLGSEADLGAPLRLSSDWMRNVIGAVGNYAEIYDRHFGSQTGVPLLRGPNSLWLQGGLLYAPPIR